MKQPLRPALPVLLVPLALGWLSIMLASELNYQGFTVNPLLPFAGAAGGVALGGWWLAKKQHLPLPTVSVLAFCLAFGFGNLFYAELAERVDQSSDYQGQLNLVMVEDTQHYPSSQGSEALLETAEGKEVRVRIFWNDADTALPKGSHVRANCTFTPLNNDQRWLFDRGIVGTLSITEIVNSGFSDNVWGALDSFRQNNVSKILHREGEGAALLAGVLLGYREALQNTAAEQDFVTCGLTHLIAVSGSHLAVVAALFSWLLSRLPLGRTSEIALLLLVLALYVMLTGLQPSAIRSALMAGVAGCSVFVGRRGHGPSALAAAALVMLLIYPANAYSIGFCLSVFAVMGITLFANLVAHWLSVAAAKRSKQDPGAAPPTPLKQDPGVAEPIRSRQGPGAIASALALTITATAATLPIAVPTFAVFSLVGAFANLIVAPLISLVLLLGMVALLLPPLFEPLTHLLLSSATWISDGALQISALLAQIPWASIPMHLPLVAAVVVSICIAALIYFCWPLPAAKHLRFTAAVSLVVLCALVLVTQHLSSPRLTVMDVGQGDALLVQEQGHTILIDTGASESTLVHALARNRITTLDAVIITHLDSDHAGALSRLRGLVQVERIYFARGLLKNQADDEYIEAAADIVGNSQCDELMYGDCLQLGSTLSLHVVWPETVATEGSNSESICLLLRYDEDHNGVPEQQALLTGDAESTELDHILQTSPNLSAGIIKVGHHGSKDALTSELLKQLESTVAIISVGAQNRYGHPSAETIDTLIAAKVRILRTDESGDISCVFRGSTLELYCANILGELS